MFCLSSIFPVLPPWSFFFNLSLKCTDNHWKKEFHSLMLLEKYVQIILVSLCFNFSIWNFRGCFAEKFFPWNICVQSCRKVFSTKRLYTARRVFYGIVWKRFFPRNVFIPPGRCLMEYFGKVFSMKRLFLVYPPPLELNNKKFEFISHILLRLIIQCNQTCVNVRLIDIIPSLWTALSKMPFKRPLLLSLSPPVPR